MTPMKIDLNACIRIDCYTTTTVSEYVESELYSDKDTRSTSQPAVTDTHQKNITREETGHVIDFTWFSYSHT